MGKKRENELLNEIIALQRKEIERLHGNVPAVMINTKGDTSWEKAPTETVRKLLNDHYAGRLSIYDYWGIGDERIIELRGKVDQSVQMVLTDKRTNRLVDAFTECAFSVDQKNCLKDFKMSMNEDDTNEGGWGACKMVSWLEDAYVGSFPKEYADIFKRFWIDGKYKGRFALRSEKEIFGRAIYGKEDEEGRQIEYYKKTRNRIKLNGNDEGTACHWWERSPSDYSSHRGQCFCVVYTDGSANTSSASNAYGLAPFGCI